MINGVLLVIAAVLFAVVYLFGKMGVLWLWIAGFYLVAGIANLIFHVIREKRKLHTANQEVKKHAKKAEEAMKKAEATAAPVQQEVLPEAEKGEAL